MKNSRSHYFIITLVVVLLGVLSRKITFVPLFVGDMLYAVMVYFGFRFLLLHTNNTIKILLPLLFCFFIEFQQLYNAAWLISIRETTLGHYALGQGFLWSDLVCYTVGVGISFLMDQKISVLQRMP